MEPEEALSHWQVDGPARPAPDPGLINRTWLVGDPPGAVLQWVNPIFDPRIHLDIEALSDRLDATGVPCPRLLATADGELWAPDGSACWRLTTYIPGRTEHRLTSPDHAREAGLLVGRFHAAVAGWDYRFRARQRGTHDTPARIAELREAVEECDGHPLADPGRELGAAVLDDWARWDGDLEQPLRPCHGDLKISNLRFDDDGRAVGLIDLDTLGPMPLVCEMGDAWRSWCNPAGEDDPDRVRFDVELFTASARSWLAHAPPLEATERSGLVAGIERICLELAARFCADALRNSYFREDRDSYPQPGAHNLLRARSQLLLAHSARSARAECETVVSESST
ncbi:MAG: aminoglycoside phosphotransferase family protein [Thermoanaerobaculia bacterium]